MQAGHDTGVTGEHLCSDCNFGFYVEKGVSEPYDESKCYKYIPVMSKAPMTLKRFDRHAEPNENELPTADVHIKRVKTEVEHLKAHSDDVSRRLKQTAESNDRLHAETARLQNALNAQCNY